MFILPELSPSKKYPIFYNINFLRKILELNYLYITCVRLQLNSYKWLVLVAQLCLTLCSPVDCTLPGSSVHGISQARILGRLPRLPPGHLPKTGTEPRSPALQADSLPSEPPGKPKNTGVGSLSLLQGIFLTLEIFTIWATRKAPINDWVHMF